MKGFALGNKARPSLFQASVVGSEKKGERDKNEGGLPRFFLARFCSSPTTESLEQARQGPTAHSLRTQTYFRLFISGGDKRQPQIRLRSQSTLHIAAVSALHNKNMKHRQHCD